MSDGNKIVSNEDIADTKVNVFFIIIVGISDTWLNNINAFSNSWTRRPPKCIYYPEKILNQSDIYMSEDGN